MYSKRRHRYLESDYEDSSDNESTDSWGLTTKQSLKQHKEFLIRFSREEDRKEPFGMVGPEQMGLWLRGIWGGKSRKRCLQVVDVRDDDFERDGHIVGSLHRPNDDFSTKRLIKELKYVDVVVFYCYDSLGRAPMCARDYCRTQKRVLPRQQVYVLTGGIYKFLKEAEQDRDLMDVVVLAKRGRPWTRGLSSDSDSDEKSDVPPRMDVKSKRRPYYYDDVNDVDRSPGREKCSTRGRSPRGRDESYSDKETEKIYRDRDAKKSFRHRDVVKTYKGLDRDESYRDRERSRRKREASPYRTPSPSTSPRRTTRRGR